MADLGFIVCGQFPVMDDYGSVILFRTREDAESVAQHNEQALPLVRWRKPRAKREPAR